MEIRIKAEDRGIEYHSKSFPVTFWVNYKGKLIQIPRRLLKFSPYAVWADETLAQYLAKEWEEGR